MNGIDLDAATTIVAEQERRPSPQDLLRNPDALLLRTDLAKLGLMPRAIDAVFKQLPVVQVPGYSRPMILVSDFLRLREESTYRGDRVRPCR